jgi:hypothetical protein
MYPNPVSKFVHGSDDIVLFEFLGRILGKALYEGSKSSKSLRLYLRFVRPSHTLIDRDHYLQSRFSLSLPISSYHFSGVITPTCIYSRTLARLILSCTTISCFSNLMMEMWQTFV